MNVAVDAVGGEDMGGRKRANRARFPDRVSRKGIVRRQQASLTSLADSAEADFKFDTSEQPFLEKGEQAIVGGQRPASGNSQPCLSGGERAIRVDLGDGEWPTERRAPDFRQPVSELEGVANRQSFLGVDDQQRFPKL